MTKALNVLYQTAAFQKISHNYLLSCTCQSITYLLPAWKSFHLVWFTERYRWGLFKKLFLFLKKYISNFCIFQIRELNFTTISAARLEILHCKNNLKILICYRLANYFCLAVWLLHINQIKPHRWFQIKKKKIQFSVDNQIVQHVVGYAAADINIFILNTLKCNMWETFNYKIYETWSQIHWPQH